ncbi:L-rhamnose-binding lectin CSL2-like [Poecilia reticulata]|uniref:L-rhamnose-binding lectin CSL2-like n=1 Tax=Poecilia reticulata TaxID=8081 RepID=UPI0007E9356A|nr:PREDICTED: L-rhamnose-binding lectin CSL2-like [Poecilia reticulata]
MMLFSATLYLASTCLLVDAGISKETVTTCVDNVVHRLSCDLESVISVETSLYGRTDNVTCSEGTSPDQVSNTHCSLAGVAHVVKKRCNGKKVCELSTDVLRGSDPCRGTAKYLQTTYTCLPAFHRMTCEDSLSHLSCGKIFFFLNTYTLSPACGYSSVGFPPSSSLRSTLHSPVRPQEGLTPSSQPAAPDPQRDIVPELRPSS